jgi:ubiquinone/menaquinone biosynthesis C-methylase UbiE
MTQPTTDIWAQWLLHRRHGGDPRRLKNTLDYLYPVRDRVLNHVGLSDGGTLLDVGCGDGLIAFGALERSPSSTVIFSDISQDLLDHAASLAQQVRVSHRCQFLCASADELSAVQDASVDAVTTRSVLIQHSKKRAHRLSPQMRQPSSRLICGHLSKPIRERLDRRWHICGQESERLQHRLSPRADTALQPAAARATGEPPRLKVHFLSDSSSASIFAQGEERASEFP